MPLTKKGKQILKNFRETYGKKKGRQVFYSWLNKKSKKERRIYEDE